MAAVLRPPGVLIERFAVDQPIEPARVDVPVFVAITERGPMHTPVRIASWPEFVASFGGFVANGYGPWTAKAFFDNGGRACWIVRVAAPSRATATSGAQPLDRRGSVVADVAGLVPGAVATVRQDALRRTHLVAAVDELTRTVTWDRALHVDFDITLPIDVETGAAAADAVLHGPGGPALRISAATPGAWGNRLAVTVGAGQPYATVNRPDQPSSATITVTRSTLGFDVGQRVIITQDLGGVVTAVERSIVAVDPRAATLTWSSALPATIDRTLPFSVRTQPFTLAVSERGAVREVFAGLEAAPGATRYIVDVLASSAYVRAESLAPEVPTSGRTRLGGGRDGTAALTAFDVLGDDVLAAGGEAAGMRGLAASIDVPEPAVVAIPDLVAPELAPVQLDRPDIVTDPCWPCPPAAAAPASVDAEFVEGRRALPPDVVLAAQQAIIEHCERHTERFALLDPVRGHEPLGVTALSELARRLPSSYAAVAAPWIRVVDALAGTAGGVRPIPPSAHMAGLIARIDAERGPWAAPANQPLEWAHGTTERFGEEQLALLNEAGVVVVRPVPGLGLAPMGVRTTSADALWIFVTVRRAMIWLRRTLRQALAWTTFEPVDDDLVSLVGVQVDALLSDVWAAGGLAGNDPGEAFFVHVADLAHVPPGELHCTIGVALARPAEFVVVQVRRAVDRLELTEAPERRSWP